MQFSPTASTATKSPRYDTDARALYAYVAASMDHRVVSTRGSGGINFDCNRDGLVLGIEVLLNAPDYLRLGNVAIPRLVSDNWHNLLLSDDPDADDAQTYDASNHLLRIGIHDGIAPVFRVAKHVFVAPLSAGRVVVWISDIDLTAAIARH